MTDNNETKQDVENNGGDNNTTKTFTQEEINAIVAKRLAQEHKKYEGVDINEYKELKKLKEDKQREEQLKRQEFDTVLKETVSKKDADINKMRSELESIKVDGAIVTASSKLKVVNPDHVTKLLKPYVKLDEDGKPTVYDDEGKVRYNTDTGVALTVEELVSEFVSSNPYFKAAGPTGTNSKGNTQTKSNGELTLADLDLRKKEHRDLYRKMKKEGKI